MSIKKLVYDYCEAEQKPTSPQAEIRLGPSYWFSCGRQIFYKKTGLPASNTPGAPAELKRMIGKALHEMLQNIFRDQGVWIEGEDYKQTIYQSIPITYRHDGQLRAKSGEIIQVEMKTVYSKGWKAIQSEPDQNDLAQLVMMMELEDNETGIIFYLCRDNGHMIEYTIRRGSTAYEMAIDRITDRAKYLNKIVRMIKAGDDIPVREYQAYFKYHSDKLLMKFQSEKKMWNSDWQCRYCPYVYDCWQAEIKKAQNNGPYIGG